MPQPGSAVHKPALPQPGSPVDKPAVPQLDIYMGLLPPLKTNQLKNDAKTLDNDNFSTVYDHRSSPAIGEEGPGATVA